MRRSLLVLSSALGVLLAAGPAVADPTKRECVTANETAQDLRHAGKLRAARANLAVCTATSCPAAVREDCAQRLKEVEAALPSLVFVARDSAGHDLSAVRVAMDGHPFVDKLDGTAVPVDPGEHLLAFAAEGFRDATSTVVVHEGDMNRPIKVMLESTTPAAPPPVAAAEEPSSSGGAQRGVGLGIGAAGAAGLVVGGIFGFLSKPAYDRARSDCPTGKMCTPQANNELQQAFGLATVSTIAFIAGGALLVTGVVVYLTAPSSHAVTLGATIGTCSGGLRLTGQW